MLLNKLPTELRQKIWRECLGGDTVHLYTKVKHCEDKLRLYHTICRSPFPDICYSHGDIFDVRCLNQPTGSGVSKRSAVSILLTCRLVRYSLSLLNNAFVTRDANALHYLDHFLLPQRMVCIRSLRFKCTMTKVPLFPVEDDFTDQELRRYRHGQWTAIWKNIANMKGLKHLSVNPWVLINELDWWYSEIKRVEVLLKPLMNVKSPTTFDLWLPGYCDVEGPAWKALPCQIRHWDTSQDWRAA